MTPLEAIRAKCRDCVGGSRHVKDCKGDELLPNGQCLFFPYRLGKGRPSVRTIHKYCLECMGGSPSMVKTCPQTNCPLHLFRLGTNPNRVRN